MKIEDQELVRRVLAGETGEFRVLVDRHQQPIFRFTVRMLGNREEAQDVTQEAFLAAFGKLSSFDSSRAAFSTWLLTIARNRSINLLKQKRPIALAEPNSIEDATSVDPIVSKELSQELDRALASLPIKQRSAFVLAEIEELPYAEIARIERTSLGTVKSRIHRAKQRLQSLLEPVLRQVKMKNEPYEQWLAECREVAPPPTMAGQIMNQVANLEQQRQDTWWLRLIQRIEHSPAACWTVCCGALAVGSLPFILLTRVSQL